MKLVIVLLWSVMAISSAQQYQIGVGIADITGPAADINMVSTRRMVVSAEEAHLFVPNTNLQMGYAKPGQNTAGIHFRLYSRAFIVDDGKKRIAIVTCDLAMVSQIVKIEVFIAEGSPSIYYDSKSLHGIDHVATSMIAFLMPSSRLD